MWNASGIARDLRKVPQSPGISLSSLYFHFSQSKHFLALSREDEATRFSTNNGNSWLYDAFLDLLVDCPHF